MGTHALSTERVRALNQRGDNAPPMLIRSGCAMVLVDDMANEIDRLRQALTEIAAVKYHPWRCSYCGHYADVFAEACANCSKVGGYSGSHDRDRVACYRVVGEIARRALGGPNG